MARLVFLLSFCYYSLLSSTIYTWLFASGDSGDWLAASNMWIVPQPYGSPLYIALGHFIDLFPGDLVIKMTLLLSALPSAITVTIVYKIVLKLVGKRAAFISCLILLGSAIFLTQSTILEEYALAIMFTVLAYWQYLYGRRKLVALFLGLGTAIHIVVAVISALWFIIHLRQWRQWVSPLVIFIISGILPYGMIIYLMTTDAPRLLAGGLSWQAINSYLGSTSVMGTLSIFEFPERLIHFVSLTLMSYGLALILLFQAFRKPFALHIKMILIAIGFPVWYYLTCLDPTTWTFTAYAAPFIAIGAGIGARRVRRAAFNGRRLTCLVVVTALALIVINGSFLNANILAHKEPTATDYYNELQSLPDGSVVVTHRGGFESMALYYIYSEGKDITPIFFTDWRYKKDALYGYYQEWLSERHNIDGDNTQLQVADVLGDRPVYILTPLLEKWQAVFELEDAGLEHFKEVKGVDLNVTVHTEENKYSAS